ncbi:hypothetical protein Tco_0462798 [Tanacetum coccineum]
MTLEIHNWSSTAHREIHKVLKDEIFPIVNQIDARLQNFEIQFLKEATKFVRDFKSLENETDESLDKQKTLEREIDRLLRAVVRSNGVCKGQLVDLKGKSKDTSCASDTLDALSQKLENENVELEFQVRNYEKENAHLKTTYKNLFDSISVTRAKTKTLTDSLQTQLQDSIYENAKLRAQLFDKVSQQKNTTKGTSTNTLFAKQSILGKPPSFSYKPKLYSVTTFPKSSVLPKDDKTNALSKPVTSKSIPTPLESKVVKDVKVIALGMFRFNPSKTSREDKIVPINKVRANLRTNPTTSLKNTAKTRRSQPRSNTKNDRVTSVSKSSCSKNKEIEVEEHHRNLLLSKKMKNMSSEYNNVKLAIRNDKSKAVCAMYSGCSKHMTGNLKLLINFIWKFLGTVRFGNDHVATILGFGDLQWGNILITMVYFVKGLGYNLFSVDIYDYYLGGQPSAAPRTVPDAQAPPVLQNTMTSTAIADSALTPTNLSSQAPNNPNTSRVLTSRNTTTTMSATDIEAISNSKQLLILFQKCCMLHWNQFVNPFDTPATRADD